MYDVDERCGSSKDLERHDRIATAWYMISIVAAQICVSVRDDAAWKQAEA
jgi:hypothetical protein